MTTLARPPALFDAHNHLQDFADDPEFDQIFEEARTAGVTRMVVNGSTEADWPVVATLARRFPETVIPAFGLHPWNLASRSSDWEKRLRDLLDEFPNAALGEIGLDRWIPDFDFETQTAVFLTQWRLAVSLNRPVEAHCLKAFGALADLLRDEPKPARGWVLHSYGGPAEMVPVFANLGASFSFSGYFLHPRKIAGRTEAFLRAPTDRILIESDAPHMAPPEERRPFPSPSGIDGEPRNHPGNLTAVATGLAEIFGVTTDAVAALTMANASRIFGSFHEKTSN